MQEGRKQKRILIVDDDPVFREVLSIGLSEAGYEVIAVENGAKAMPVITSAPPDVLLVDMLMPAMDGLQLLRWMKEKTKLNVPTLVLTCMDSKDVMVDSLVAGAADVMTKPFHFQALLRKLSTLG